MQPTLCLKRIVMIFVINLLMIGVGSGWAGTAEYSWKEIRRDNDIVLYQKRSPDPDWILFRGECLTDAPVDVVATFLSNLDQSRRIFPYCKERRLLKAYSERDRIEYLRFRLMWPFRGRYLIQRYEEKHLENGEVWFILNDTDAYPLEVGGMVRSRMRNTQFVLKPFDGIGQTHVSIQIEVDPGGWLPNWFLKQGSRLWMYDMLINLKEAINLLPE